jgi:LysM repeat protein
LSNSLERNKGKIIYKNKNWIFLLYDNSDLIIYNTKYWSRGFGFNLIQAFKTSIAITIVAITIVGFTFFTHKEETNFSRALEEHEDGSGEIFEDPLSTKIESPYVSNTEKLKEEILKREASKLKEFRFKYLVKKGDTLSKICADYKVDIEETVLKNKLTEPDYLEPNTEIVLLNPYLIELNQWYFPVPSRVITSGYGWRNSPSRKFHEALDLKAHYEPVHSVRAGKVIYTGWLGGYGNTVILEHDKDYKSLYAHNSRIFVQEGDYVLGGTKISKSGCTGYCFGPHLHFELIFQGKSINPSRILKGLKSGS